MAPNSEDKVFVGFEVKQPYYGYIWEDSRVRIRASGFLGQRQLEVTTGVAGRPTAYEKNNRIIEVLDYGKITPIAADLAGGGLDRPYSAGEFSVSNNGTVAFTIGDPGSPPNVATTGQALPSAQ